MATVTKDRLKKPLWCGETRVAHKDCVWLSCFNPHDCGYTNSRGRWTRDGRCLTRDRKGCPDEERVLPCCDDPLFTKFKAACFKRCLNCGMVVPVEIVRKMKAKFES